MSFANIPELLEEIRAGRMVVIVDDEDRENEGDLIMAAELVRPQDINFMVTHARGLVCLSLTRERCRQLGLPPMVQSVGRKSSCIAPGVTKCVFTPAIDFDTPKRVRQPGPGRHG